MSGTSVARDFVELPSQLNENWAFRPEVLRMYARHYETGEVIPDSLITKIVATKNYLAGYSQVRQLQYGIMDMAWHTLEELPAESTVDFEKKVEAGISVMPETPGTAFSPTFSHIFSGGYAAGYYSYKWSEVLAADAYSLFKEKGIFNREVSGSFRDNILSKGNSEDVAVLYKVFYNSQKVVLSCVSKYHYMIHQNESITRGSYNPVKEYHFFLSLYEQDCFLRQVAKFGNEPGINALKRGIHLVNHTFLCPDSPAYEEILDDAMKKIRAYNHIPSRQLGFSLAVRRYLLCRHYTLYRQLYRGFRSLFKRRHKSMMD